VTELDDFEAERGLAGRRADAVPRPARREAAPSSNPRTAPRPPPCEALVRDAIALEECLVPWYLICGYAYEALDEQLVSDALFDRLCRALDDTWDQVEHRHKHLVDRASLSASTCGYLTDGRAPSIAVSAATRWAYGLWPKAAMAK